MVTVALGLGSLGIEAGEEVRFRARSQGRWRMGTVTTREADGSVRITDLDGASRSLPPDYIEVRARGRRGGRRWEPLLQRAGRAEQLRLL